MVQTFYPGLAGYKLAVLKRLTSLFLATQQGASVILTASCKTVFPLVCMLKGKCLVYYRSLSIIDEAYFQALSWERVEEKNGRKSSITCKHPQFKTG